jgi:hypothetical protein
VPLSWPGPGGSPSLRLPVSPVSADSGRVPSCDARVQMLALGGKSQWPAARARAGRRGASVSESDSASPKALAEPRSPRARLPLPSRRRIVRLTGHGVLVTVTVQVRDVTSTTHWHPSHIIRCPGRTVLVLTAAAAVLRVSLSLRLVVLVR